MYQLTKPIKILGITYNYLDWYMQNYPVTNNVFWQLLENNETRLSNQTGVVLIPQEIIDSWGKDDSIIPKYIEQQIMS